MSATTSHSADLRRFEAAIVSARDAYNVAVDLMAELAATGNDRAANRAACVAADRWSDLRSARADYAAAAR